METKTYTPKQQAKRVKLLQEMNKVNNAGSNNWERLRRTQYRWESKKAQLEKAGLWREFCDLNHWSYEATFFDLGA